MDETMASSRLTDVVTISKCNVKPVVISEESKRPYYLTPWDIPGLDAEYGQFGLLFNKPDDLCMPVVIELLKNSLATALAHFFPLSGRFVTQSIPSPPSYCVYIDCNDSPGAGFIHAVAPNLTLSDILTPTDVPSDIIESLFGIVPGTPNNRGHALPLLAVQVTQLVDGIFVAFSINQGVADGTSFWQFINSYSEICRSTHCSQKDCALSHPPVTKPWFPANQCRVPGSLPTDRGLVTPPPGVYRQRVFHVTSKAIAQLKAKANVEYNTNEISSYKSLAAFVWRAATRARRLRGDQMTTCAIPVNCRSKLELSRDYFGKCYMLEYVSSTVDELLSNNLGWAAWMLHNHITKRDNNRVRAYFEQYTAADCGVDWEDPGLLFLGSSPWLDVYGNDFGWGNPVAVRCGDMGDGYVHMMPGRDKGSVDIMMCFFSNVMNALELDVEFMSALLSAPISKF